MASGKAQGERKNEDTMQLKAQLLSLITLTRAEYTIDTCLGDALYDCMREADLQLQRSFFEFIKEVENDLSGLLLMELKTSIGEVVDVSLRSSKDYLKVLEKNVMLLERYLHLLTRIRPKFASSLQTETLTSEYEKWVSGMRARVSMYGRNCSDAVFLPTYIGPIILADPDLREVLTNKKRPLKDAKGEPPTKKPRLGGES